MTSLWFEANGAVEKHNRSILKGLKIAQVEKSNWRDELSDYLTIHKITPHSTTGVSPSEMLFKIVQGIRDAEKKGMAKYHAYKNSGRRKVMLQRLTWFFLNSDRETKRRQQMRRNLTKFCLRKETVLHVLFRKMVQVFSVILLMKKVPRINF